MSNSAPKREHCPGGILHEAGHDSVELSYTQPEMTSKEIEDQKKSKKAMLDIARAGDIASSKTLEIIESVQGRNAGIDEGNDVDVQEITSDANIEEDISDNITDPIEVPGTSIDEYSDTERVTKKEAQISNNEKTGPIQKPPGKLSIRTKIKQKIKKIFN